MQTFTITLNPTFGENGPQYQAVAPTALAAYGQVMRGLGRSDKVLSIQALSGGPAHWITAPGAFTARVTPAGVEPVTNPDTFHRYA